MTDREGRVFEDTVDEGIVLFMSDEPVAMPGAWGDLPLVVVTAEEGGNPRFGDRVAALSRAGRHVVAEGSGHYVQYERPQIVVDAILEVLERGRS